MKIREILKITEGKLLNLSDDLDSEITGFELDSRKIKDGDCFIAINKGNNYIKDVIDKVSLIITENDIKIKTNIPIIRVFNIINSIQELAKEIRLNHMNIPLIAVTGSVGKTTTKELIYEILSKKYKVLKNEGNENNHIGLPKTLLKLNKDYDFIVTEMGMNHLGEIESLSNIALPDIGVITSIGTAHIGNLKTKSNILKAKMEITTRMNHGILIVNGDDKYLKKQNDTLNYEVIKCGYENKNNDFNITNIKEYSDKITFIVKENKNKYPFIFNIPNRHILIDVILAVKIGLLLGVDIDDIIKAVKEYKPVKERMNILKLKNENILVDDAYNASYESLKGSLEYVAKQNKHKIIILGDILELGNHSKKIHFKIARDLRLISDALILLVGKHTKIINEYNDNSIHFKSNDKLIEYLETKQIENTIILLKGSNAMNLKEVKKAIIEFDKNK